MAHAMTDHSEIYRWLLERGMSMQSPWGTIDRVEPIGDSGLFFASTSSHGGYFVPTALNQRIPEEWRSATWRQLGLAGWYEKDCDAVIVPICFPEFFDNAAVELALATRAAMRKAGFGWPARVA
jgi:hypothetical protein